MAGFHEWADGKPLLGAYRVERSDSAAVVCLLIDWRQHGEWYIVLCSPINHAPLAQIRKVQNGAGSTKLVWQYRPLKHDGANDQRVRYFRRRVGDVAVRISVPRRPQAVRRFLDDLYALLHDRLVADTLGRTPSGYAVLGKGGRPTRSIRHVRVGLDVAGDIAEPPARVNALTSRIIRDTRLTRHLKSLHDYRCQICGTRLELRFGQAYAEAHHLRPLGRPHNGLDTSGNVLILCPNCHVLCDLAAVSISGRGIRTVSGHRVSAAALEYHRGLVRQKRSAR